MVKWKQKYLEDIIKMTNEEVLDEYTYFAGGDDYDGCLTRNGEWKYKEITKELIQRLTACGFLINDAVTTNMFEPNWVSAPGDTIKDILEERNTPVHEFARGIHLNLDKAELLLSGDYEIDVPLAHTLGQYFGISTQFWINREATYRNGLKRGLKRT